MQYYVRSNAYNFDSNKYSMKAFQKTVAYEGVQPRTHDTWDETAESLIASEID